MTNKYLSGIGMAYLREVHEREKKANLVAMVFMIIFLIVFFLIIFKVI